jgi:uncharacterized protein (DUF2062 family)
MIWMRKLKYGAIRMFRMKSGNHQVALGFIIGLYPCWFPTFGIGPAISLALAKVARGNILASLFAASLGSVAWPVLFYLNYKVGNWFGALMVQEAGLPAALPHSDYGDMIASLNRFGNMGANFLLGAFINSLLSSIVGYVALQLIFSKYRFRILQALRRSKRKESDSNV